MKTLTLPLPPPINQTYGIGNRRMYKTDKAKEWENLAGYILLPLRPKNPMKGRLCAKFTMFLKWDRDLDSSLKLLFDLMQKMRFYVNDSQIDEMRIKKVKDKENPRLEIEIKEI